MLLKSNMNKKVKLFIDSISTGSIKEERKEVLNLVVDYIQKKKSEKKQIKLVFICTHNSRRSQLSELWANVLADYMGVSIETFSGGVEVTEFNERAIKSLKRIGFDIKSEVKNQPYYTVFWSDDMLGKVMFSKLYDNKLNPDNDFAALMTCSDADENCPFILGTDERIPLRYEDPKLFDDTPKEEEAYDLKSLEIATEMKYIFSKIK